MRPQTLTLTCLAGLAISVCAAPAVAQNALGDGRRLDRSLSTQSNYNSGGGSRGAFTNNLRLRNAVVTGNVAGGKAFRGDIGYTGSSDFRGDLGSDDIYSFRRDTSFQNRFSQGTLRGIGGLQNQFGLTSNSGGSVLESAASNRSVNQGGLLVQRAGAGATGSDFLGENSTGARRNSSLGIGRSDVLDLRTDYSDSRDISSISSIGAGSLRSTSAYTTSQSFSPSLVGQRRESDGSITSLTASSLRGVRATTVGPDGMSIDPTAQGYATATNPAGTRISNQANLTNPAAPKSAMPQAKTAYDSLMDRYKSQTGTTAGAGPSGDVDNWQKQLDEIRAKLEGQTDPSTMLLPTGTPSAPVLPVDAAAPEPVRLYNQSTIDMILRQAGESDKLLLTSEGRLGAFGERMRRGEDALATGRYFDAEEAFSMCLTLRPGDVSASMGRVHAQLGAGMFLSAALNLRTTLGASPQVIGERYAQSLLPSPTRCTQIMADLRTNIANADRLGYESAILLAYLGFQTKDKGATLEGLAAVDRLAFGASNPVDARFVELVRRIWIPILDRSGQATPIQNEPAGNAGGAPGGG